MLSDYVWHSIKSQQNVFTGQCPNQNAACVRGAIRRLKAKQLQFPPRSGDLNPIKNVFRSVKQLLHKQAICNDIEYETYDEFKIHVIDSVTEIDNTIASMNKRIDPSA